MRAPGHIAHLLEQAGRLARPQVEYALSARRKSSHRLVDVLLDLGLISEPDLAAFLAQRYELPLVALADRRVAPAVADLVPSALVHKHQVVPVERNGDALTLAMDDPTDVVAVDAVAFACGLAVRVAVAVRTDLRAAIARHYTGTIEFEPVVPVPLGTAEPPELLDALRPELDRIEVLEATDDRPAASVFDLKASASGAPVVKLVNTVLADAIDRGASDVHVEPGQDDLRVRFRIDGLLYRMLTLSKSLEPAIISRLKIMADLDIAERRLPQDGRVKIRYGGREIDVRLSVLPTLAGEKALLRILDRAATSHDLATLGFDPWAFQKFQWAINQPHGMILITGPTGSGKTTTLYAAVQALNGPTVHVMTAEDPVEYRLPGVNQVQINEAIGRTFAATLRSFLRQDPDVILVGETRDNETAQISVRAALTGHLLLSTLHTNDCPSAPARLADMGVAPFLTAASLLLVVGQRLVRRVCAQCAEPVEMDETALAPYGHVPTGAGVVATYRGKGCAACSYTGLKHRVGIYEVMPVSDEIREGIMRQVPVAELRALARRQGMKTLREAGLARVLEGVTTVDEVLRVTLG